MTGPYNRTPTTALQKALRGLPPLPGSDPPLEFVNLYVDSALGNDDNTGAIDSPFRTLARAWYQRLQYLELRVVLRINLLGAGPYDMPPMGASECAANGYLIIKGDAAARTVVATGTATGDFTSNTLPTSALVANAGRDDFLRMTSGACAGAIFQINENAVNSVTVSNRRARNRLGAIVNGDTFEIVRPGTQIRVTLGTASAEVPHQITDWKGLTQGPFGEVVPKHTFFDVRFVTSDASSLRVFGSEVGFVMCRIERGIFANASKIVGGFVARSRILDAAQPNALDDRFYGAGFVAAVAGALTYTNSLLEGIVSWATVGLNNFGMTAFVWGGGRAGGNTFLSTGAEMEAFGAEQDNLINANVELAGALSYLRVLSGSGIWRAALTSGTVLRARLLATITIEQAFTGGTTDAGGYGVSVQGGGRCLYRNVTPALTGGTAGSDIRTTNVAVAANAVLNANNVAVGNAADALLGEVLARVL